MDAFYQNLKVRDDFFRDIAIIKKRNICQSKFCLVVLGCPDGFQQNGALRLFTVPVSLSCGVMISYPILFSILLKWVEKN